MLVVFNSPVRLEKTLYPKSPRVVEVADKLLENKFCKALMECGKISLPVAKAEKPKAAAPAAKA